MASKTKKSKTTAKRRTPPRPKKTRRRQSPEATEESMSVLGGAMKSVIREAFLQRGQ